MGLASGTYRPTLNQLSASKEYIVGKSLFYGRGTGYLTHSCNHCHQGALELRRSKLLLINNKLPQLINDCQIHSVYCGSNALTLQQKQAIVYFLQRRFRLPN